MTVRCQQKTFKGDLMCWRPPIPLVRLCVMHAVEQALNWFRFEWRWRHGYASVDLSNINRLRLSIDECRPIRYVELSWGAHGCDPVWAVGWQRREP